MEWVRHYLSYSFTTIVNQRYFHSKPLLSQFVRQMLKEDEYWHGVVTDYENRPADGIRGRGGSRRDEDIAKDNNLRELFEDFQNRMPYDYLRTISYLIHYYQN